MAQHGGARPGAGRKSAFNLFPNFQASILDHVRGQSSTPLGLQNRAAIALAAYGAREDEIAACLNIHPAKLEKKFGRQTALGRGLRRVNVLLALHQAADLGRVSAIMLVLRLIEEADRRAGRPHWQTPEGHEYYRKMRAPARRCPCGSYLYRCRHVDTCGLGTPDVPPR
jgi:hypothetical protein